MQKDEGLQQQFEILVHIWKERHGNIRDEDNVNARNIISKIINRAAIEIDDTDRLSLQKKRRNRRRISLTISSFILILAAGWFWFYNKPAAAIKKKTEQDPIVANNGSTSRSLLPDGTTVWLNAGSKLHYENDFNGTTREVRLEGEAFFDVVKHP
ncbi:MAG: FecR domain-containing protein, partial [Chitinophagaceae bacterium]